MNIHPAEVPAHLRGTYQLLAAAYPDGIPEWAYRPMLALLHEHMSLRAIARVMAFATGKDYSLIYNDVLGIESPTGEKPDATELERVKQRLNAHGFAEWLAQE